MDEKKTKISNEKQKENLLGVSVCYKTLSRIRYTVTEKQISNKLMCIAEIKRLIFITN